VAPLGPWMTNPSGCTVIVGIALLKA